MGIMLFLSVWIFFFWLKFANQTPMPEPYDVTQDSVQSMYSHSPHPNQIILLVIQYGSLLPYFRSSRLHRSHAALSQISCHPWRMSSTQFNFARKRASVLKTPPLACMSSYDLTRRKLPWFFSAESLPFEVSISSWNPSGLCVLSCTLSILVVKRKRKKGKKKEKPYQSQAIRFTLQQIFHLIEP